MRWEPIVGRVVRLHSMGVHNKYDLPYWTHLKVLAVHGDEVDVETASGPIDFVPRQLTVELKDIEKPIGWQEVYEMTAPSKEVAEKMYEWLDSRGGITVWQSVDLSCAGRQMYTPGDRGEKPHWSVEMLEVVTDVARCDIGYEEVRYEKPSAAEKKSGGWTYDRRGRLWYRRVKLERSLT